MIAEFVGRQGVQTLDSRQKCLIAVEAAREKKARDMVIFEVARLTTIADYFLICSADSQRQVKAIMDHIDESLARSGETAFSVEGEGSLRWVLMDYSDVVIHIFDQQVRAFYALERLWGDAPRIEVKDLVRKRTRRSPSKTGRTPVQRRMKKAE
jgi:ribosome-associated protein